MNKKRVFDLPSQGAISFSTKDGESHNWEIVHDIPESYFKDLIMGAFVSWANRATEISIESFCRFIKSRGHYYCIPLSEYNLLIHGIEVV